jgi:hypothetical protein
MRACKGAVIHDDGDLSCALGRTGSPGLKPEMEL